MKENKKMTTTVLHAHASIATNEVCSIRTMECGAWKDICFVTTSREKNLTHKSLLQEYPRQACKAQS
jgi:hypothetical protein